jgi:cysteinyl-tRNA synthetase
MSSGAALAVALQEAEMIDSGTIVVIFPDSGERYLSTPLFTVKDTIGIQLFNTLTRNKQNFEPRQPGKVSIFTCGPTAHRKININDYRRIVFGDMLGRYLAYRGYTVNQVVNVTDLDDKMIAESQDVGMRLEDYTADNIDKLKKDVNSLNVSPTLKYAYTSDHISSMVQLAEKLVQKGYAYEKLRSLYFNIARSKDYGRLSGVDINKIRLGATVDLDEYEKDNPRDFTLFKRSRLSELKRGIFTKTPWGNARPSWHIQSAALAHKFMGENLDIYISSRELMFPHNENEIAISQALTGRPTARYWLHCDRILADGRKIDPHASGPAVNDLIEAGYSGEDIRFWLISNNYRKPIIYSTKQLDYARRSLNRINGCINALIHYQETKHTFKEFDQLLYDLKNGFTIAMDDDLNISAAIASMFKVVKRVNTLMMQQQLSRAEAKQILDVLKKIDNVLQVLDFQEVLSQPKIQALITQREEARRAKNWGLADNLREQLLAMGIETRDRKI